MYRFSAKQTQDLSDLATRLAQFFSTRRPPHSKTEASAAAISSWIEGVLSSAGYFAPESWTQLCELLDRSDVQQPIKTACEEIDNLIFTATQDKLSSVGE